MTASTGRDPEPYPLHQRPLRTLDTLPRVGIWDLARDHGRFFRPQVFDVGHRLGRPSAHRVEHGPLQISVNHARVDVA